MERKKSAGGHLQEKRDCPGLSFWLTGWGGSKNSWGGETVVLDDPLADLDLGIVFNFPLPPPGELPRLYAKLQTSLPHGQYGQ